MTESLVGMLQRGESAQRGYNDYNRNAPRPRDRLLADDDRRHRRKPAMENGIDAPERLSGVAVRGSEVHLQGPFPGERVSVDLRAPTPDMQAMSDHMREQAAERAQQQRREPQILVA